MKNYYVYCHTLNNKQYVGYTKKSIARRLAEHITDSENGSQTHFHRAIRKYGAVNIITEQLAACSTHTDAKETEIFYINKLNTCNNGYNMTNGGDGGNTKIKYTKDQLHAWGINRSQLSAGMNNGNAKPHITQLDIVATILTYIKDTNKYGKYILRKEIDEVLNHQLAISSIMLRNRGIKNHSELIQLINANLTVSESVKYDPYYRSPAERIQLSLQSSKWKWVTNGEINIRIAESELHIYLLNNNNYHQGRTLKK